MAKKILPTRRQIQIAKARISFWEYRKLINPDMVQGWWQKVISDELELFYHNLAKRIRPKLVIQSPPQHGKSIQIIDFISWVSGLNPDLRTIYGSYSERLGVRANLKLQKIYDSPVYKEIFPNTRINSSNVVTISGQTLRNREIIEYAGRNGYFRNTTVRGSITGESLDLGIIDDPIKGRSEANSSVVRESTWDWFTDDFFSRFSESAGMLMILTRWHVDDPVGRMEEKFPDLKIVSYPAIATQNEKHRKIGEALFPELKSLEFLLERKSLMSPANFNSLYQQSPTAEKGELFSDDMFDVGPVPPKQDYSYITVDTAYKEKQTNDYHVFLGAKIVGEQIYIDKIFRKRIKAEVAESFITKFIEEFIEYGFRGAYIEPKGHGIYLNQKLPNNKKLVMPTESQVKEFYDDRNLSKVERANNVVPYLKGRKIIFSDKIPEAERKELLQEILEFPNAKHDDFADCVIDIIKLVYATRQIPKMSPVSMTAPSKWNKY